MCCIDHLQWEEKQLNFLIYKAKTLICVFLLLLFGFVLFCCQCFNILLNKMLNVIAPLESDYL